MRITDAHFHFWNEHMAAYHKVPPDEGRILYEADFTPAVLKPLMNEQGVDDGILVQTYNDHPGTDEFLSNAFHYDWIVGVVGWVDLRAPNLAAILDHYQGNHPKFKGIRHLWQDENDAAFMLRPDVMNGMKELERRGLTFDVCVNSPNWPHMQQFVDQLPDLPMVIDHIAKPRIFEHQFDEWAELMGRMAQVPRMMAKLSGLVTEARWRGWEREDFDPYVDYLLETFGADRLMFGSDWPVCLLAADSYAQTFDLLQYLLRNVNESGKAKIMGETCRRFYGIE